MSFGINKACCAESGFDMDKVGLQSLIDGGLS